MDSVAKQADDRSKPIKTRDQQNACTLIELHECVAECSCSSSGELLIFYF